MGNFGGSAYAVTVIPSNMGGVAEVTPPEKATSLRCVLVHAPGSSVPERLEQALRTKKIETEATDDIYAALVLICRLARDEGVALPILALVEPERIAHAADLVEAVSVYAPKAVQWAYAASPRDQIREVQEDDLERWRIEQGETETRTGSGGKPEPDPRAAGISDADPVAGSPSIGQTSDQPGSVLTDEELNMLLADDDVDDTGPDTPGSRSR